MMSPRLPMMSLRLHRPRQMPIARNLPMMSLRLRRHPSFAWKTWANAQTQKVFSYLAIQTTTANLSGMNALDHWFAMLTWMNVQMRRASMYLVIQTMTANSSGTSVPLTTVICQKPVSEHNHSCGWGVVELTCAVLFHSCSCFVSFSARFHIVRQIRFVRSVLF